MNTIGGNRSVVRTQTALKNGLTELLLQKPIQQISVKELTEYVNLNRGTFYLHYKDIYDLLDHLENEMFADLHEIIESHPADSLQEKPFPFLKDIFQFLGEHADFCRILLDENHDKHFIEKLIILLRDECFSDLDSLFPKTSPEIYTAYYSYILYGCIGIIENWLLNNCEPCAEKMASLTETIILHGILVMEK